MTTTIEQALEASHTLLTVREIMRETGHAEPVVRAELRRLAGAGQIEHIPGRGRYDGRYGLLRTIAKDAPSGADSEGGETDVRATIAPEGDEMPPANPALLASANRMLSDRLEGVAHALRGCGLPALSDVTCGDDLQQHVAALSGAYQMARAERDAAEAKRLDTTTSLTRSMQDLDAIRRHLSPFVADRDPAAMTEVELAQCAAAAVRDGIERIFSRDSGAVATSADTCDAVDVLEATSAYLVRIPKRRPRIVTKPEKVREAAVAAVRNGAERAEVFALIPLGTAKRGAVWRPAK